MVWFSDNDIDSGDIAQALRVPIGMMSPLWFTYGAVASAGVAFWLVSNWAKPFNLEAYSANLPVLAKTSGVPALVAETVAALQPEPVAPNVDAAQPDGQFDEAVMDLTASTEELTDEIAVAAATAADDLTRLAGIGPTLAAKLADLGVRTYADIAAWTEEDLAKVDQTLELRGRATREAWIDQARQFAAQ